MDGFRVETMEDAAAEGEIFITVTGNRDVLRTEHFERMPDGAIVANSGHFDVEIDLIALARLSEGQRRHVRPMVEESRCAASASSSSRGSAGEPVRRRGPSADVMDMSFANQALAAEWVMKNVKTLEPKVYNVPRAIDAEIARLKLETMGVSIDPPDPGPGGIPGLVADRDLTSGLFLVTALPWGSDAEL